jgi:endonuclease/exonuclease/phosphatase family metal-dependent hydrolase
LEIVGVGPKQRIDQLNFILEEAKQHDGPVIVCGDMNTTIPSAGLGRKIVQLFHKVISDNLIADENYHHQDERHSFLLAAQQAGFKESIDIRKSTWCIMPLRWEIFSLKLDWFLVRNIKKPEVSLGKYISDHRSVLAKF